MPVFVVLLRAVNVGGTGKLPMSDLKRLCEKAGFRNVRTYIASGNVVAGATDRRTQAKAALEAELRIYAGKPVGVIVRTAAEMAKVVALNPFPDRAANQTVAIFLDRAPPPEPARCQRPSKRGDPARRARDLRPLSRRDRPLQAAHPGRQRRDRAQHEHRRQAGRDGGGMRRGSLAPCLVELIYFMKYLP